MNDDEMSWSELLGGNACIRTNVMHHANWWMTMNWVEVNCLVGTHNNRGRSHLHRATEV